MRVIGSCLLLSLALSAVAADEKRLALPVAGDLKNELLVGRWYVNAKSRVQKEPLKEDPCQSYDFIPLPPAAGPGSYMVLKSGTPNVGSSKFEQETRTIELSNPEQPGVYTEFNPSDPLAPRRELYVTATGKSPVQPLRWWQKIVQWWRGAPPAKPYAWAVLVDPAVPAAYVLARGTEEFLDNYMQEVRDHLVSLAPHLKAEFDLFPVDQTYDCKYAPLPPMADSRGPPKEPVTRVGVAVMLMRDGKILIGKRKGSHGAGKIQFPGGHMEFGEDPVTTAIRETEEETGLVLRNPRLGPYTNDVMPNDYRHYVSLFVVADSPKEDGEPRVMEPNKNEFWKWVSWEEFKKETPLFLPLQNLVDRGFDLDDFVNGLDKKNASCQTDDGGAPKDGDTQTDGKDAKSSGAQTDSQETRDKESQTDKPKPHWPTRKPKDPKVDHDDDKPKLSKFRAGAKDAVYA